MLTQIHRDGSISPPALFIHCVNVLRGLESRFWTMEKIDKLQFPLPYAQIVKMLVFFYIPWLAFTLAPKSGWTTPVTVVIAALGFFGLDEVAEILESPFGDDPNDIDLDIFINMLIKTLDRTYLLRQQTIDVIFTGKVDEDLSRQSLSDRQWRISTSNKPSTPIRTPDQPSGRQVSFLSVVEDEEFGADVGAGGAAKDTSE